MTQIDPGDTTVVDICRAALKECGAIGVGQTPLSEDINDAWTRLQWMLQQWERKRWLVYHLVDVAIVSTGATVYSIGPGGNIDTNQNANPFNNQFNNQFGPSTKVSVRPDKIESAYLRQLVLSQPNQIDYPLTILQSREDYNKIALKQLNSFPSYIFYDTAWPLGFLYPWPIPQAAIYEVHVTIKEQLPVQFLNTSSVFNLPYEYYNAMVLNLAIRLRPKYGIATFQGDMLPGLAKDALAVLRGANTQIARLGMPPELSRPSLYNIFSDRVY